MSSRPSSDEIGDWGEQAVKNHLTGRYQVVVRRSPGSRTTADIRAYFQTRGKPVWFIQVKASLGIPGRPSSQERSGLVRRAENRGAIPVYARVWLIIENGEPYYKRIYYYNASTNKIILTG
jgi:hypothetical protein